MTAPAEAGAPVVYLAGSRWDDVEGTDRRLVTALARHRPVLWVDPPQSLVHWRRARCTGPAAPGITRVSVLGPPALSRPVARSLTRVLLRRKVRRAVRRFPGGVDAVISAAPHGVLGSLEARRRIFFATDDYVAGAGLMGLSVGAQARAVAADVAGADVVVAVSPGLAEQFAGAACPVIVIPNGCDPAPARTDGAQLVQVPLSGPIAGLVGQLNERLDLDVLHRLRAARVPVLVVGPLTARDRQHRQRLLSYLYSDNVHWVGACDTDRLRDHLAAMSVGVTPYRRTAFNRGSFPLKTLDYLAAGLPVVTTPLPATAWLDSPLAVQADNDAFVDAVRAFLDAADASTAQECRALASRHDWASRAAQFAELCDPGLSPTLA